MLISITYTNELKRYHSRSCWNAAASARSLRRVCLLCRCSAHAFRIPWSILQRSVLPDHSLSDDIRIVSPMDASGIGVGGSKIWMDGWRRGGQGDTHAITRLLFFDALMILIISLLAGFFRHVRINMIFIWWTSPLRVLAPVLLNSSNLRAHCVFSGIVLVFL